MDGLFLLLLSGFPLYVYLPTDEHLGCFQFCTHYNKVVINILHVSLFMGHVFT